MQICDWLISFNRGTGDSRIKNDRSMMVLGMVSVFVLVDLPFGYLFISDTMEMEHIEKKSSKKGPSFEQQ